MKYNIPGLNTGNGEQPNRLDQVGNSLKTQRAAQGLGWSGRLIHGISIETRVTWSAPRRMSPGNTTVQYAEG